MTETEIHNLCGLWGFEARKLGGDRPHFGRDPYLGSWNVRRSGTDTVLWTWTFSSDLDYYIERFKAYLDTGRALA